MSSVLTVGPTVHPPSQTLATHLDQARAWMRFLAITGTGASFIAIAYALGALFGVGVAPNIYDTMLFGPLGVATCLPVYLLWQSIESVSSYLASPSAERLERVARDNARFWSLAGVLACVVLIEAVAAVLVMVFGA